MTHRTTPLRLAAVLVLALACAAPAAGQDGPAGAHDAPAAADGLVAGFVDDVAFGARLVGRGLTAPARWTATDWLAIPAATAVLAGVSLVDDEIADHVRQREDGALEDVLFAIEPFGRQYSWLLIGGLYVGGFAAGSDGLRRTAVEVTAASILAGGITVGLKLAFGRARPRQELGTYAFDPLSGDESLPSGHATQAFAVASVIAAESPHLAIDLVAYGLAGTVAVARIYDEGHFLSDVLAGAAIGTVVGRSVAAAGRPDSDGPRPFVTRLDGRLGVGLAVPLGR